MSVNEKIKLVRQAKGLTQEAVAEKLGMSVTAYGDIERGDKGLKVSKLQEIADVLEMTASELLDLTDKTVLNINLNRKDKGHNKYNVYLSSDSELEKQQLIISHKDEIIVQQKQQIADLREHVALLKKEHSHQE